MNDTTLIVFSFPREVILDLSLADTMGKVQDEFKNLPGVQIFSVVGGAADKIVKTLEHKDDEESGLVLHAMRELALAGNDEDFDNSIIAAVEAFASYGHSGGFASFAIPMLNDLLLYKNLTPLTDDPKEWNQVEMGEEACWQCVRNPEAFSNDGGKTYYLLSEGGSINAPKVIHESAHMYRKGDFD